MKNTSKEDLEKERREALDNQKRLEERAKQEEELREKAAKATVVTCAELMKDSDEVKECYVPELDRKIKYKELLVGDMDAIRNETDPSEQGVLALYLMWSRGDSTATKESIKKVSIVKINRILIRLGVQADLIKGTVPLGQNP